MEVTPDRPRAVPERFEEHLAQTNVAGARLGYLLAAVLMPAGLALDFAMAPELVWRFLAIRLVAGAVALAALGLSYSPWATRHPVLLGAGPPFICAAGIEAMILHLGGVTSPYYAGLNLCILAIGVLYTWRWRDALVVSGVIVVMWLLPAVPRALTGELPFRPFVNNLYFLTLTTVISVASTVIRYRSAQREHQARTELSRATIELEHTLQQLTELDRLKNEFFANVSHELRTPLTLILSPVEDLLSREQPARQRELLAVVRRNGQRLLRMIDDLLDLARLDVGGLRLRVAEADLADIAGRVVGAAKPTADARSIELELDAETTPDVHGDLHRLEIVVTNLVSNALKFTPEGGYVRVRVRDGDDGAFVAVSDDGPGIPKEERARIFDRFYQVEGSERRRHGGAGIGLSLAKRLAELHGGSLEVDSQVGEGSTFRLWLPHGRGHLKDEVLERRRVRTEEHPHRRAEDQVVSLEPPPRPLPSRQNPDEPIVLGRGRRARIVVAEDEADLRQFIAATLSSEFDVLTAGDGAEALALVERERPDLLVTDVMMPGVSGADLCRKLKSDDRLHTTPVIMLTALSSADAALEGYAAGADDYVTKPFHTRVLLARVRAQLRLRALGLQLADQARLASAGTLAAGLAHEVKNPINAVLNAARVLRSKSDDPSQDKLLAVVEEGADRVQQIVSSLEEHVRPAEGVARTACDVHPGLDASVRLIEHKLNGARIHRQYESSGTVAASGRELNQVFLNLMDNAVRARPRNIWVRTTDEDGKVQVVIADDGPGIPPDHAELVFQPFFTTRDVGEGSGLGLYLCRRMVEDSGGSLHHRPRAGGGAEFVVQIPALEAAA